MHNFFHETAYRENVRSHNLNLAVVGNDHYVIYQIYQHKFEIINQTRVGKNCDLKKKFQKSDFLS